MKIRKSVKSFSLRDLVDVFIKKFWIILMIAVLVTGAFAAVYIFTFTPVYESTATLYILKQGKQDNSVEASQDFSLALNVVTDCTYLLKSHAVVDKVIDELKLDMSYKELSQSISTNNPENTRILEVSVKSDSPEQAREIVNEVCGIGADKITDAMGTKQVNVYEHGTYNTVPVNRLRKLTYILIALVTAAAAYLIFVINYFADDRLRSSEDIKQYLGISVLGEIPDATETHRGGKYYGKKYGYGYGYGRKKS